MIFEDLEKRMFFFEELCKSNEVNILTLQQRISELNGTIRTYKEAAELIKDYISACQMNWKTAIEPVVTQCLQWVFDQPLYFHILFLNRYNRTECEIVVLRDDQEQQFQELLKSDPDKLLDFVTNVQDTFGGAVVQVIGLVLHLIFAHLVGIKGPIFLDEPTSMVHPEFALKLGIFIKELSNRYGRNYVVVTHSKELASTSDILYKVEKVGNISTVQLADLNE